MQLQAVNLDNAEHAAILQRVYERSGLDTDQDGSHQPDYRKLGFVQNPPAIVNDFLNAGVFGLHILHQVATVNKEAFAAVSSPQLVLTMLF